MAETEYARRKRTLALKHEKGVARARSLASNTVDSAKNLSSQLFGEIKNIPERSKAFYGEKQRQALGEREQLIEFLGQKENIAKLKLELGQLKEGSLKSFSEPQPDLQIPDYQNLLEELEREKERQTQLEQAKGKKQTTSTGPFNERRFETGPKGVSGSGEGGRRPVSSLDELFTPDKLESFLGLLRGDSQVDEIPDSLKQVQDAFYYIMSHSPDNFPSTSSPGADAWRHIVGSRKAAFDAGVIPAFFGSMGHEITNFAQANELDEVNRELLGNISQDVLNNLIGLISSQVQPDMTPEEELAFAKDYGFNFGSEVTRERIAAEREARKLGNPIKPVKGY